VATASALASRKRRQGRCRGAPARGMPPRVACEARSSRTGRSLIG
jgi:hypothetical protein